MRNLTKILTLLLSLIALQSIAQDNSKLISVDFNQARVEEVVQDIEAKTSYKFYYDLSTIDSLRISVKAENKIVSFILEQAFKGSDFHFAISGTSIFLTKGKQIKTLLADGYYPNKVGGDKAVTVQERDYFNDNQAEKVADATIENKIYAVGVRTNNLKPGKVTMAGYLRDVKSGEPIVGASIYSVDAKVGAMSDQFGFYSITLPTGKHTLSIKSVVSKDARRQIMLYNDGKLNIELQEQVMSLKEVKISADKIANIKSVEMGVNRLNIKDIKQVPSVFGEPDILRVVLTLPGVQSVGEASTGFSVRGGSQDQNLILLNDATIYNPSHFFGFFSAFNPDIVKDVQLYKSTIPERFGGRLSSVLEVNNREGNKKKFTGTAGIGLITSRFNIEGPIDSNKTSFILGGRTTYSNWLLKLLPDDYKNSKASFTDINLGISHQFNEKNNLYFSGYFSTDKFKLNSDTTYSYSNKNISLKWKHIFNNKIYGVFSAGADRYEYNINSEVNPLNAYSLDFNINQLNLKSDFTYYLSNNHTVNFGLSSIHYKLNPGSYQPLGDESITRPDVVPAEQALESALYIGDKYDIGNNLSISAGLRYSLYNYLGPQTINNYAPGLPRTSVNQIDSTIYGSNKLIKTYSGPEIRLSARYNVNDNFSIKGAYNTLRQYIHLLSNTTAIAPTDVWKLSDPNIKPQFGSQVSLGLYKNFKSQTIETSVEFYYKKLKDYLDYRSGANLVLNRHIETDVLNTEGKAYGVELFVRKTAGNLNGWMSYAYSRTLLKMNDPTVAVPINGGDYYPANYDKPHAFNFTGNYRFSHRFSISLNATYSTGRPITLPIAKYYYAGSERVFYSDRNAYRIPDYFRTDLSMNIEGNHKVHQRTHNSWTIGVYNLTGRQNAYSAYFTQEAGVIKGFQLSIFATAIPFVNYNIRF
ncbi:TonB-dependent receptor [Pedobacter aquatilis]|uniref:TonB-dependent receptor n=1 Tax=Pedobacter aquatilis TaxID=351343 RepID=UPI0025B49B8C|nr:carboxypeptidase-like regulatory domain-containing protein [Pedobacter aquatilis]MDN3587823.1 TonB-dependent receptor [Pedobacter aquatilis]